MYIASAGSNTFNHNYKTPLIIVQCIYFVGYKFPGFVKILISWKIKFADCKHNLALGIAELSIHFCGNNFSVLKGKSKIREIYHP